MWDLYIYIYILEGISNGNCLHIMIVKGSKLVEVDVAHMWRYILCENLNIQ